MPKRVQAIPLPSRGGAKPNHKTLAGNDVTSKQLPTLNTDFDKILDDLLAELSSSDSAFINALDRKMMTHGTTLKAYLEAQNLNENQLNTIRTHLKDASKGDDRFQVAHLLLPKGLRDSARNPNSYVHYGTGLGIGKEMFTHDRKAYVFDATLLAIQADDHDNFMDMLECDLATASNKAAFDNKEKNAIAKIAKDNSIASARATAKNNI